MPLNYQDEVLRVKREHHRMIFLKTNKVPMFDFVNLSRKTILEMVEHGDQVGSQIIKENNYQAPIEDTKTFKQYVNLHKICNSPWMRSKVTDKQSDHLNLKNCKIGL
jgi:hypothetical protein